MPAPRTLSPEAESTIDSIIQSVDKPILRVSHAMLCQEAPKRYDDTKFSEEWLVFVPAPRTLSFEAASTTDSIILSVDKPILRVRHAMLCQEAPALYADTTFSEEWLAFVLAPRALSHQAESTTDSII